jgi:hypothetical protein
MYSKAAWGGPVDPFILTVFPNDTIKADEDPVVSLIIFEWKDLDLIGVLPDSEAFTVCAMTTDDAGCVLIATLETVDMRRTEC